MTSSVLYLSIKLKIGNQDMFPLVLSKSTLVLKPRSKEVKQ